MLPGNCASCTGNTLEREIFWLLFLWHIILVSLLLFFVLISFFSLYLSIYQSIYIYLICLYINLSISISFTHTYTHTFFLSGWVEWVGVGRGGRDGGSGDVALVSLAPNLMKVNNLYEVNINKGFQNSLCEIPFSSMHSPGRIMDAC